MPLKKIDFQSMPGQAKLKIERVQGWQSREKEFQAMNELKSQGATGKRTYWNMTIGFFNQVK